MAARKRRTKLYYFSGRNTGVAAKSAAGARKAKRRGGNKIVAVRTPKRGEMRGGKWSRVRRDGKSPGKSRYGKGRGCGPRRK